MITVAIIAVLSAIAIPVYTSYIRRSYLSEATTSISAIKSAEESFFTINNCYIEALAHPATVPAGVSVSWDSSTFSTPNSWARNALGVRPDKNVRFQYQVYASNSLSGGGCGSSPTAVPATLGCVANAQTVFANAALFPSNWYIVVARGDLNGDNTSSTIISGIDDSQIVMCNELQ
ncbi:MAG: hypothetical protein J0L93_04685 [Deltaproteobacteria bacterium]|nr:hypothetical protein [Deltaproteobacteria bacterium]